MTAAPGPQQPDEVKRATISTLDCQNKAHHLCSLPDICGCDCQTAAPSAQPDRVTGQGAAR